MQEAVGAAQTHRHVARTPAVHMETAEPAEPDCFDPLGIRPSVSCRSGAGVKYISPRCVAKMLAAKLRRGTAPAPTQTPELEPLDRVKSHLSVLSREIGSPVTPKDMGTSMRASLEISPFHLSKGAGPDCFDSSTSFANPEQVDEIDDPVEQEEEHSASSESLQSIQNLTGSAGDWCLTLIDCRFPFEYRGGHIVDAVNSPYPSVLLDIVPAQAAEQHVPPAHHIIVFYCEFSSERAPKQWQDFRQADRGRNSHQYPRLSHPYIYVMAGGYRQFVAQFGELCAPRAGFIEMNHASHQWEMRECFKRLRKERSSKKKSLSRKLEHEERGADLLAGFSF
ncbi:M-phase inducer phosphatase 1-B [Porphyridium purpureum]|uniref:protein-tyrosine-phosphatase n=1 Tax=Porphyridium purpureum TaxID=35688 RepID=A0A5J4YZI7_PORPP|nr:M-phase inducer phosphatase 1-B [Porphyridium purpureum]|eukprot:POR8886..scf209_3